MKKGFAAILSLFLVLVVLAASVPGAAAQFPQNINIATYESGETTPGLHPSYKSAAAGLPTPNTYVVVLSDPALAAYRGGIKGIPATSPQATGENRLDANATASLQYKAYLAQKQSAMLAQISGKLGRSVGALHQYKTALNGFAVRLSEAEAEQTAGLAGVQAVLRDTWNFPTTDATPNFIGATSIWDGTSTGGLPGTKGEGIIVGVIDTGIWPEHLSFKDDGTYAAPPASWGGECQKPDDGTTWLICNNKLIGAQHFLDGYIAAIGGNYDGLFNSARDDHSHGTHTASTSAGNENVPVTIAGRSYGTISGIAPRAYVAAYKALGPQGGVSSDLAAAIDTAVADGVDVINYSIGGPSQDPWQDAAALAMLNAREAGVFVAVSAGNAGPGAYTVSSPADAPWVTTVGASTSNRAFLSEIMLSPALDPVVDTTGASMSGGVSNLEFVDADNYVDKTGTDGRLCLNAFAANTFTANQVVLCERGTNARVEKSANVATGGAGGMILANSATDAGIVSETHSIPTVHVEYDLGMALRQHIAAHPGTMISFAAGQAYLAPNPNIHPDSMGDFSSRGPANQGQQQYSKPVIAAPGVEVLAGYSPRNVSGVGEGELFGMMSGTSMASPHVAGAGALLMDLHPDWTPAEIESALTTTAITSVQKEDHLTQADAYDMGSGRVDLLKAARAGLVLDETKVNFLAANPSTGGDPAALNLPSMTDSMCLAECTWTRTVRSTLSSSATWTVSVDEPAGIDISVAPAQFTLAPGAAQEIQVTVDVSGIEPDGTWAFGRLTLTPNLADIPAASFPVTVFPTSSIIPDRLLEITDEKAGQVEVEITAREITNIALAESGLVKAATVSEALTQDPTENDPFDNLNDGTSFVVNVNVPSGAVRLVAETLESTSVDLDLFVGTGAAPSEESLECYSATASDVEYCNINLPAAGQWWILVQNFAQGANPPDEVTLRYGVVAQDQGNFTASAPAAVPAKQPFTLTFDWALPTLEPQEAYYGAVQIGADQANPGNVGIANLDILYTGQARLRMSSDSIDLTAMAGQQANKNWSLYNDGDIDLVWTLSEEAAAAAAPVVLDVANSQEEEVTPAPLWDGIARFSRVGSSGAQTMTPQSVDAPDASQVLLKVDDGVADDFIRLINGGQLLWLNRFTPQASDYPFVLDEVQALFLSKITYLGTEYPTNVAIGDTFDIFIWKDIDGDDNPATNAQFLASIPGAKITELDSYVSYALDMPVLLTEPGDVLIGLVNHVTTPNYGAAAQDTSLNKGRSWLGLYAAGNPGNPPALPADLEWGRTADLGIPGNWMIRGAGRKCSSADELEWLNVTPTSGEIAPAGQGGINLAVDASGLQPGVYQGTLCLQTNAGNLGYPLVSVPVSLTVDDFTNFLPLVKK